MKKIIFVITLSLLALRGVYAESNMEVTKLTLHKLALKDNFFTVDEEKIKEDKIPYGCKVKYNIKGLTGFIEKEGEVSIDASIEVLDSKGQVVLAMDSVLHGETNGRYSADAISELITMFVQCQTPMQMNRTYTFRYTIKDQFGDGKMIAEKNFLMTPAPGISYKEAGLKSDGAFIYLKGNDYAHNQNVIPQGGEFYLLITGISGATVADSSINLNCSIRYFDKKGVLQEEFNDLFESKPINAIAASELLNFTFAPPKDAKKGTAYTVEYAITDIKSKKKLTITYNFVVGK
jgi:hypothetical protein